MDNLLAILLILMEAYQDEEDSTALLKEAVASLIKLYVTSMKYSRTNIPEDLPPTEQLLDARTSLTIFDTMCKAKGFPQVFCSEISSAEDLLAFCKILTQHALSKLPDNLNSPK